MVLAVCDGYRIPRPTREADRFVEAVKRGERPQHPQRWRAAVKSPTKTR